MSYTQIESRKLVQVAAYASVSTALLIIIVKIFAWRETNSLSLLSSLVDSMLDIAASVINLAAIKYALIPADDDHRFGHGKAEDLSALMQSLFILISALFILKEAVVRLIHPVPIEQPLTGIYIMLFSIGLTSLLVMFQLYVVKKTQSIAIAADAMHYKSDWLVNLLVLFSLGVSMVTQNIIFDISVAVVIAIYILVGSWKIGKRAFDHLMDKEFSEDQRQNILRVTLQDDRIAGVHDLRTRKSGVKPFIQLHLELDGHLTLQDAHAISEEVELRILNLYPDAEILVHQDPVVNRGE